MLTGTVTDGTGAVIRGASAHLAPAHAGSMPDITTETDGSGHFSLSVPPGEYVLSVEAPGFARFRTDVVAKQPNARITIPVRLAIASLQQEISVLDDETEGGTNSHDPSALIFEGDRLKLLSNDNATLQQELRALAGGFGSPQFLIDGFSGGRLPPKSSIRSIRINRNQYSAYYSDYGFGRVEISTKPGTDKIHGQFEMSGTDQPLNARDPYAGTVLPFYDFQQDGSLNGPIGKKTSFFASELTESLANTVAVNAADPAAPLTLLSSAAPAPQLTQTYSLRFDREISKNNFAYIRDEWNRNNVQNNGIGPLILPEAAFRSNNLSNALQLADTQILGSHAVNEARFQYLRTRVRQDPNSTRPSVLVQGALQCGGSPNQLLRDNQDAFELQDLLELEHKAHAIRAGLRFRALRDANTSTAWFNGQYVFPDVSSYLARTPEQFSQTVGEPGAILTMSDTGVFAEDDWKINSDLTLSYGVRFESQTAIPDHFDPAPRIGFSWAVRPGKRKTPLLTLSGGYGLFYDRFPAVQLLQAIRQNGTRQIAYITENPGFNPVGAPTGAAALLPQPTVYRVDPDLHTSYSQNASLTVARSMARFGNISANLVYQHQTHTYLTRNVNAPLPGSSGTGDLGTGPRPLGTLENIYQFSSAANGNTEQFFVNYRVPVTANLFAFGIYAADKDYNETDGIGRFPSDQYDLRADYGRVSVARAQQFTGGLQWALPHGFQVTPFLNAHSGAPFDITTGTDLNGDTIYNDRPALATAAGSASVLRTALGTFDVAPASGQKVIPRNYGTAPGYFWLMLRAGKDIHLGPRPTSAGGPDGKPAPLPDRPWDLNVGVEVHNLTNHNNPGLPVGAIAAIPAGGTGQGDCTAVGSCALLPSPFFGHSLSLAPDFSPITASNRTILLQTSFSW